MTNIQKWFIYTLFLSMLMSGVIAIHSLDVRLKNLEALLYQPPLEQTYRDKFGDFDNENISMSWEVSNQGIDIFLRDTKSGIMARISGNNTANLILETR